MNTRAVRVLGGERKRAGACLLAILLALLPVPQVTAAGEVPLPAACSTYVPVLVVGGTPAGVAAAVAAARLGSPVILTEARPYLGGVLTASMLNTFDMDVGPHGEQLARGIFLDVYHQLGMTFDVETAKRVFLEEVQREPLVSLRLSMRPVEVVMQGPNVAGVELEDALKHERQTICAKRIVDATDDADIAAMAGVPYRLGREGSGRDRSMMAATLVFGLGGVDLRALTASISGSSRRHMRRSGAYHGNIWGFRDVMRAYQPSQPGIGILDLNIGLQSDGTVLINGLLVYGVDGTDPASVADGMRRARAELPDLVSFLRASVPGFADAELVKVADELYIRETRHVWGLYTLTVKDIESDRMFWDAIGVANYPIDLHPYHPGEVNPYAAARHTYTIPLRALVPLGTGNLLLASRSISASYEAAGSTRVIPTTMEEGQAAGTAAVLSLRDRVLVSRFADTPTLVHELQETLSRAGAYLPAETLAAAQGPDGRTPASATHRASPPLAVPAAP